jgi:predicted transcriptional regulator
MRARRMKRLFSRRALIGLLALAFVLFGFVSNPSRNSREVSRQLSAAMNDARAVQFVEFEGKNHEIETELVFRRVFATPQQIDALREAIGQWYAPHPGRAMACYEPHHRVEVLRTDGTILSLEVCFMCGNYGFGDGVRSMPEVWRQPLRNVFTDAGMPPRSRAEYEAMAKNHPDYDQLVQKQNEARGRQAGETVKAGKPESQSYSEEMLEYMKSREAAK